MLLVTYQTLEAPSQDFMSFIELAEVTAHLPDFVEGDSIREFIGCEVYRDPVTARDAGSRLIGAYRLSNLGGHCESGEGVVRLDGAIWMACMRRDQRSRIDIQIKENRFHDR